MSADGDIDETYSPSDEDIELYERQGWFVTPPVLPHQLLDEAKLALEEHWSGQRDVRLPVLGGFSDWMPGSSQVTRNNEYFSLQNYRIRSLAWSPIVGRIAARLARTSEIRLFDDQMVVKPPGQPDSSVGWHVDGDYWQTCTSTNLLTAWIPLHDCPAELGPLVVLTGSHRWSHLVRKSSLSFHGQHMNRLEEDLRGANLPCDLVPLAMRRGQMSFHHARTLHGSFPNRGASPRVALALHLQDGANQYQEAKRANGSLIQLFNDRICRADDAGRPDYKDDQVFPLLWPLREAGRAEPEHYLA